MRWLQIREAKIDPELRKTFDRYGVSSLQILLSTNTTAFRHQGSIYSVGKFETELLDWLTEKSDETERRETWSLSMEVAITVLVGIEVLPTVVRFVRGICW
jgi:hypothetical protein